MSDIFLSYSRKDRSAAELLTRALEKRGWTVWWDRSIPAGKTFDELIEQALDAARCQVVLWSGRAAASRWVRAEASEGARREILVPVRIEACTIPLAFRGIQTADLTGWRGDESDEEFRRLVADICALIGEPSPTSPESGDSTGHTRASPRRPQRRRGAAVWLAAAAVVALGISLMVRGSRPRSSREVWEQVDQAPKARGPGESFRDCPTCPEMVAIPGGTLLMGSPAGEAGRFDDEATGQILVDGFALGRYEVTRAQYAAAGGEPPSCAEIPQGADHPAVCVSRDDVQAYLEWLSRETDQEYRLPTEAEWEYAARAGSTSSRFWGDDPSAACGFANVADRKTLEVFPDLAIHDCSDGYTHTAPVGTFEPNAFGLHDVLGNAGEWVQDCWRNAPVAWGLATAGSPERWNPYSPENCRARVVRGGSWWDPPRKVRSAYRAPYAPDFRQSYVGFRVARSLVVSDGPLVLEFGPPEDN